MNIVISQSMLFPWVGLLEQIRISDVFVHYDDVQFSKGSFTNRVQIKTVEGMRWMTIPLRGHQFGQAINQVQIQQRQKWERKHVNLLERSFYGAPYAADALKIAEEIYSADYENIGMLARSSMIALANYFDILKDTQLIDSSALEISGKSTLRVLEIVKSLGGQTYITGHGGLRYINHDLFESEGIKVSYMNYKCIPYRQNHGAFTPYVSGLDLVANCGRDGRKYLCSEPVYWKDR